MIFNEHSALLVNTKTKQQQQHRNDESLGKTNELTTTTNNNSHGFLTTLFEPLYSERESMTSLPIHHKIIDIESSSSLQMETSTTASSILQWLRTIDYSTVTATISGSLVFSLYHTVFILALASAIVRPHATHRSTGAIAKLACLGVLVSGPTFVYNLGHVVPAIYPSSDLFLAPFLAQIALEIDTVLAQKGLENKDDLFLGTFVAVTACIGLVLSSTLCIVAARIRLANLGLFLPYPVLCGFFSTVGFLMWSLGFRIDTGQTINDIVQSGEWGVIHTAVVHHLPSLAIGIVMHLMGQHHPLWVLWIMLMTVLGAYVVLWWGGITLHQATDANWFFAVKDLLPAPIDHLIESQQQQTLSWWKSYGPTLPFGGWVAMLQGNVDWDAAAASLSPVLSLAFLYLIRCSVQAAALKKNIPNVTRHKSALNESDATAMVICHAKVDTPRPTTRKNPPLTLNYILEHGYGYAQLASALVGGITVAPAVAASSTLFHLGAEMVPPQYGSCLLMLILYITEFRLVQYIAKPALSCLMILAGLEMIRTWLIGSYYKTKDKLEWLVCPILVVFAFTLGMLKAILLGVAISTFIFAHNFYRAGTVKFVGTGKSLRSTLERGICETRWLDENADLIQILVLQNYLFFGNVQSVSAYIMSMFQDIEDEKILNEFTLEDKCCDIELLRPTLLPKPTVVVIDFSLVCGFDTSAIDQFREMIILCRENKCKLLLAGLSASLKSNLHYVGLKPEGSSRSRFAYVSDLESALAKAEDILIADVFHLKEKDEQETLQRLHGSSNPEDGFAYALQKIDEQHGLNVATELRILAPLTTFVELEEGETLMRPGGNSGLYFVETGLLHIRPSSPNHTAVNTASVLPTPQDSVSVAMDLRSSMTIGGLNARSSVEIGPQAALWVQRQTSQVSSFNKTGKIGTSRLAKIGQGWIIEAPPAEKMAKARTHVAISNSRLHFLSHASILELERTNPRLVMNLYKLLSILATKRQEATIHQLEQFVKIMKNPVPRLRGGRRELTELSCRQFCIE